MNLQMPSFEWLLQLWPLALMGLVVGGFMRRGMQRRVNEQIRANAEGATRQGLSYKAPGGEGALVDEGVHRYAGRSEDIDWTAEVLMLAGQHHVDPDRTPMGRVPYIRWSAPACSTQAAGGGALALMNMPPGVTVEPRSRSSPGGWMGELQTRAGGMALKAWLGLTFGSDRVRLLTLGPEHGRPLDTDTDADAGVADGFSQGYRAFADRPELLHRLTPVVRDWLLQGRDRKLQLLWDEQGLTLMWPSSQGSPGQVQACADFGTTLWRLMRGLDGERTAGGGEAMC